MRKQNRHAYWLAPAAVLAAVLLVFLGGGYWPFGVRTLSWCDMNQQVVPLLMSFQNIVHGDASMFLNLQNAGGMDFWGVFFFFLASPFTSLTLLVPKADLYAFMNLLVALKMAAAALTASIAFARLFPRLPAVPVACFSCMYAWSGFTMLFYQNIIWLDVVALFPLLLLGYFYVFQKARPALLTFSTAALLVINYYEGAIVLLWMLLAGGVFAFFAVPRARRGRGLLLTALAVALSLLATAVVWLPSFLEYLQSGRTVDLLSSVSSGSFTAPLPTTLPVLLCTALAVGAPVFFFSGRSRAKGLWCVFVLFLLMLLPLLIDPINRMWHLGSYQAFPARYGFIPVFLGLLIAAWYLAQTERLLGAGFVPKRRRAFDWVLPAAAAALLFALAWRFLSDALLREELSEYVRTLWGDTDSLKLEALFAACALCGFLLLFLLYRGRRLAKPAFCVLLCALTLVEGFFHMDLYIGQAGGDSTAYKNVLDLADRVDDDSLYRVKLDEKYFDANLLGGLGYNALSHYTSLTGETALNAMKWLGYSSYWMEIGSNGGTALTDALLAQKYTIALRGTEDGREVLYQNGDYSIVKTPYTLPFGVVTQSLGEALADGDRFQMQQMLFESVFGIDEPLFTRFSPIEERGAHVKTDKGGTTKVTGAGGRLFYSITVSKKTILYLDCFDEATTDLSRPTYDAFRVTVNGRTITPSYPKDSQNGILELGTFEPGQVVDITLDLHHDITCSSFGVAGLDVGLLEKALASASCADLSQQGNTLSGTVDAKASGWLLLPIPAEAGYTATVNGEPCAVETAFGSLLAVKVPAGVSEVTLSFTPPGFAAGLVLSGLGVVLFVCFLLAQRRGWLSKLSFLEKPVTVLFGAAAFLEAVVLFVFPVVVYWMVHLLL